MAVQERIVASTDGSCLGTGRGPAGWAWFIDEENWDAGGIKHGTAQQAELLAVLNLLKATPHDVPLHILADSTYAIGACTKWRNGWKRRGWMTSANKQVANVEIVMALDAELTGRTVTFEWVKGHSGVHLNERADALCGHAALSAKKGSGLGPLGPGCVL